MFSFQLLLLILMLMLMLMHLCSERKIKLWMAIAFDLAVDALLCDAITIKHSHTFFIRIWSDKKCLFGFVCCCFVSQTDLNCAQIRI